MPTQSIPQENKMGTMPVKKLIFNMALPLIISMLIQALYNIVDSIFVSRISEDAFTAVSLVFPIQNLMIAFATGTGVGINSYLSRALGETMVVLMVAGGAAIIPESLFDPLRPMTASIAAEMAEAAVGSTHYYALFATGLVLFVTTFIFYALAFFLTKKFQIGCKH